MRLKIREANGQPDVPALGGLGPAKRDQVAALLHAICQHYIKEGMDMVTLFAWKVCSDIASPVLCDRAHGRCFVTTRVRSECGSSAKPFVMLTNRVQAGCHLDTLGRIEPPRVGTFGWPLA